MIKQLYFRLKRRFKRRKKPHIFKQNGNWWIIGKEGDENFRKACLFASNLSYKEGISKSKGHIQ